MDTSSTHPVSPYRVLIFGGTGMFGTRLVGAILSTTPWNIIVAGRSMHRLKAWKGKLPDHAGRVGVVEMDASLCSPQGLAGTEAQVVVDVAGPFQQADYSLAQSAISAGMDYVDIADSRAFVGGFSQALDSSARKAGVVAITGASSTPALSNAALDNLVEGWREIVGVTVAISPGNRAPRGLSVVQAILSYTGRPIRLFTNGRWSTAPGWGMTRRLCMPGLGWRWTSLCDTPDLDIVPARHRPRRCAIFLAGLELSTMHLGLVVAGWLVRAGVLSSLEPLARTALTLARLLSPFGTDQGGMMVRVEGRDELGRDIVSCWSLVAQGGDGPSIPVLPALACLRRLAAGRAEPPGARPCVGVLSLEDIVAEMAPYRISTHRSLAICGEALFPRVMGPTFEDMPVPVRKLHRPGSWRSFTGKARISGSTGMAARIVRRMFGFPGSGEDIPVQVIIASDTGGETWLRSFGLRTFHSRLTLGRTASTVEERFGPLRFELALQSDATGLSMAIHRGWMGPLPIPSFLLPRSRATEGVDFMGRFCFDVPIDLPMGLGRMVCYTGWLVAEEGAEHDTR
jgi:hypothetical protein